MASFNDVFPAQQAQQQPQSAQQQQLRPSNSPHTSKDAKYLNIQKTQGTSTFTPIPTRLPPPPTTTRRNIHARATQQQKTTATLDPVRQPSLSSTLDQQVVLVQPEEHIPAQDITDIITSFTSDIPFPNPTSTSNPAPFDNALPFMAFNFDLDMAPVEWDQFLVDTDLGDNQLVAANSQAASPASSHTSTPKSTESEQSAALDPETDFDFDFGFDLPNLDVGITHRPEDIFISNSLQLGDFAVPDARGTQDPTMTDTFGLTFGDFGLHTELGADAASQLGLTNLLDKFNGEKAAQQAQSLAAPSDLTDAYALLDKLLPAVSSPVSVQPSQLSLPPTPPALKRKASEISEEAAPAAKRRGRPPGLGKTKTVTIQEPKRAYRRQSKSSSLITSGSPALSIDSVADADDDESDADSASSPSTVKRTISGKPSTARPKSVVPEKFLKDGSAQAILGMDITTIQSFPTFEELLKKVDASLFAGAKEFGERIAENRDKAKDAAKKSRDERRAKIERSEILEKKVEELEATIKGMTSVFLTLVDRGILNKDQVAMYL